MKNKAQLSALQDLFNNVLKARLLEDMDLSKDSKLVSKEALPVLEDEDEGDDQLEDILEDELKPAMEISITRLGALDKEKPKKDIPSSKPKSKKKR